MSDNNDKQRVNIAEGSDPIGLMLDASWNLWVELQLPQEAFLTSRALIDIIAMGNPDEPFDPIDVALASLFWGAWNTPQRLTSVDFAEKAGIEIEAFKKAARAIRGICGIEGAIDAEEGDDTPFTQEEE